MSEAAIKNCQDGVTCQHPVSAKEGAKFIGWYLTPDFSGSAVSVIRPTESLILYAKFERIYTISYITNGGQTSNPTQATASDSFVLTDAVFEGEFFGGWYSDNTFTNRVHQVSNLDP